MGTAHARGAQSGQWATQIRHEIDLLVKATDGIGVSALITAVVTEAVAADKGQFKTTTGELGYAWDPKAHHDSKHPVDQRLRSAAATLGRVMVGGHLEHRSYLAFMEGIYQVATNQDETIADRIQELWDAANAAYVEQEPERPVLRRPSIARRMWTSFLRWWRHGSGKEAL